VLEGQISQHEKQLAETERALEECRRRLVPATPVDAMRLRDEQDTLVREMDRLEQRIHELTAELTRLRKEDFEESARNCETADALEEAIAFWRELLALDAAHPRALEGIDRLGLAVARKRKYSELVNRLAPFFAAGQIDARLYGAVVKVVRVAHKSMTTAMPEIGLVELFVDGALRPDKFKEAWEALQAQGDAPAGTAPPDVDFAALSGRLSRGELVVLVGAILQSPDDLADALAAQAGASMVETRRRRSSPPSEIAEYFEMNPQFGPLDLVRRVSGILPRDPAKARLYGLLAKITRPVLVISSSHDTLLEQAFQSARKQFVVVSTVVNGMARVPAGKLIVKYCDRPVAEPPMDDQALSHEAPMDKGYSVLFKVRGVCDEKADASDPVHRTFTLSENRHFAFARQVDTQIPNYVGRHFSGRGLLVLGYSPVFWEDRLILNAIVERCRATGERSAVVTTEHNGFAGDYWQSRGVSQFAYSLDDFVARLDGAMP
jgi:hypothetical protein